MKVDDSKFKKLDELINKMLQLLHGGMFPRLYFSHKSLWPDIS